MTSKLTREQATDKEIQMLIDSHENGTAMFLRVDAYYLMAKELQERRRAALDSEPVAYMWDSKRNDIDAPGFYFPEHLFFAESNVKQWGGEVIPLYRHAQQPVVPDNSATTQHFDTIALETAREIMCDVNRRHEFLGGEVQLLSRIQCRIDDACRAAMLQAGNSPLWVGVDWAKGCEPGNSPVIPDGSEWTNEQCLEFLTVAFRHNEISGDIEFDDIRLGVKFALSAAPQEVSHG